MKLKPVIPRTLAIGDVEDAVDYYVRHASETVALEFIDALEDAYRAIAEFPAAGSPRYAYELSFPSLRGHQLGTYPYIVFYVEQTTHIDVWRVLHAQRDIPAWMHNPES